jgi:hypothetical protein
LDAGIGVVLEFLKSDLPKVAAAPVAREYSLFGKQTEAIRIIAACLAKPFLKEIFATVES